VPCSNVAHTIYEWEQGGVSCAAEPAPQLDLLSAGVGTVIDWQAAARTYHVWTLGKVQPLEGKVTGIHGELLAESRTRFLYQLGERRVGDSETRTTDFQVYSVLPEAGDDHGIGPAFYQGEWDDASWGHEVMALDDDYVLRWWNLDGQYAVWKYDPQNERTNPVVATSFSGTNPALRRGARIVNLGAHRLLEWIPVTGEYRIWPYHFTDGTTDIFDAESAAQGHWDVPGPGDDIVAVKTADPQQSRLLVWTRATGHVRQRTLDPQADDPMSGADINEGDYQELRAIPRDPPTTSRIKNLVIVLQRGRSFDSYFGKYCQAPAGSSPTCNGGPVCCEAIPGSIAGVTGAAGCQPLDPTLDPYTPDQSPACMLAKVDAGGMDGYATATSPPGCGDPRTFVCAGIGDAAGAVGVYHEYAAAGALADHFFQSSLDSTAEQELIYISKAAHGDSAYDEGGTQITQKLADARVPWALYIEDPKHVEKNYGQTTPYFFDQHWTFFRNPDEILSDVDLEQLPVASVVVSPTHMTEDPGDGPPAAGIAFVKGVVDKVLSSPRYRSNTLVVVAYLTSGGFYDHVAPPPAWPACVDVEMNNQLVAYGPRVPLLALGPFAKQGYVSHVQLELNSLTVFLEWNWLGGPAGVGSLGRRDQRAANLGSLLDFGATGTPAVPDGPLLPITAPCP
jgi:hypothetical protein